MYAIAMQEEKRRGVHCKHCGKAVRLSHSLVRREEAIKQNESAVHQDLQSRVFPVRCKMCHSESIYSVNQIVDL
jgi:cytochrome c5